MREIWEVAEALEKLGLATRVSRKGRLKVYRDGIRVATFRLPDSR